jgi:hypothetical protein
MFIQDLMAYELETFGLLDNRHIGRLKISPAFLLNVTFQGYTLFTTMEYFFEAFSTSRVTIKRAVGLLIALVLVITNGGFTEVLAYGTSGLEGSRQAALPGYALTPPSSLGHISDLYTATPTGVNAPSPLVILIQDLHAHYGVQKNIAALLDFIRQKKGSFPLAVEGAQGPIDSSVLALFPNGPLKQQALDFLMRQGELTGMEYFAAQHRQSHLLVGVEDNRFYQAHRQLFRQTYPDRTELVHALQGLGADLDSLASRVSSVPVLALQHQATAFESGALSFDDWTRFLVQHFNRSLSQDFPALDSYLRNNQDAAQEASALQPLLRTLLTRIEPQFSTTEKNTLHFLAQQPDSIPYSLYLRDLIYKHKLFLAVPDSLARDLEHLSNRFVQPSPL